MNATTSKLVVGMLAAVAAAGMTGGAASAVSSTGTEEHRTRDSAAAGPTVCGADAGAAYATPEERQVRDLLEPAQPAAGKVVGRVSYARAAAANLAEEAQGQPCEVLAETHRPGR